MNILNQTKDRLTGFLSGKQIIKKLFPLAKTKEVTEIQANKSNDSFFDMFYHSHAAMLLLEPQENGNHTIIDVNKAAELFYGYSRKKFLKLHIGELNTASKEERQHLMAEALQKSANTFYFKHILANKELKDVQIFSSPILVDGRKLMYLIIHDITEQNKALQSLEENNERFKKLSQLTFEGILIHKDGIILDANLSLQQLSGYKMEEVIGRKVTDFIETQKQKEIIEKNIAKEYATPYESKLIKKDGTVLPIEIEGKEYTINNETFRVAAIRNITEKKETLNSLLFLNKALNNSKEVIFTTDKEGVFNYINSEFTKLFGYTDKEIIGVATPRILKSGHTSDIEYDEFWRKLLQKKSASTTYINKTKSGKLIDIEASADPILDENDSIIGFLAIQRDITEKKKQELKQAVLSSITKVVLQDMELEALLRIIQSEINKLMDARNFYIAFYDKDTDTIATPYFSDDHDHFSSFPAKGSLTGYLIEQKKSLLVNRELFAELKKSKAITGVGTDPMLWLGTPLTKNDEVIGAFVIQSYIDENAFNEEDLAILEIIASQMSLAIDRKQNEIDLRKALVKAQESERLKFTFLATMSHELRTPLNAIIGFSDLIDESRPIEEIISFCQVIHKSGNHLLGIVNEIFDFTLIETGEIKLSYEEHNLKEILSDVHQIIEKEQVSLGKEHLALSFHIPPKAKNLIIRTDKQRLQQVLLNLLKNALKFTDSGSIKFGFNLIKDENKAVIQFYVEDTGIGIDKDQEEIIFDVFRQADDSTTRKHDGVGLGLAISKRIITLLGGELWLKSKLRQGSTFFFNIPCPSLLEGQESAFEEFDIIANYDYKNQTILIAEDDPSNYTLLEFLLQPFNVNLLWAKNGKEALDIFNSNPNINLILVDIKMPKLNGIEVTKFIKKMNPSIPVIVHTAYSTKVDKDLAFKAGCDDYITKPFQKQVLFKLIRKYLD